MFEPCEHNKQTLSSDWIEWDTRKWILFVAKQSDWDSHVTKHIHSITVIFVLYIYLSVHIKRVKFSFLLMGLLNEAIENPMLYS